ncbi:PREDICTED: uncharacterized protein LOC109184999 [Ipomoea nil]|uniref:uncharacterized protein LOC109184999 n=1 Tax=Ipomoea nil TaxID=35883 RepID=UPI000900BFFA|nr:PREDICTED: uncharacterized protein LOC109184999 [Ipomoea nil]
MSYFLGIEICMNKLGLNLCQHKYALDILAKARFLDCKAVAIPMVPSHTLKHDDGTLLPDASSYRHLVERLLCLTATRPNIAYVVHQLSQIVDALTDKHLIAAHRVLRYIKGAPGQALISWRSKKQPKISISSSEAEYRALAAATCEVKWISYLLKDYHVEMKKSAVLFCDNKSIFAIDKIHVFHERTKHIEIDCHLVRENVSQGLIKLLFILSSGQVADGFTKSLPTTMF